ncbi:helix-turn-helix transcriptional regulator [Bacillus massiliglaciei]|uniref:helix-turn-helix transcriptional regulator n=1 Tax=Bacillus massiliglaciei TaxID=1816693 RepID=UPI000DA61B86|nr:helix-turn-helix transcriptional regulator [Bacillus massiliglaciei]
MKCLIGNLIKERGLKHKFIADKIGVSTQQISNWINMRNYPTIDKAFKLAQILGVKVDDLYEEE